MTRVCCWTRVLHHRCISNPCCMQEAAKWVVGSTDAHDTAIVVKHHTAKSFFRRRQSAPTLKRHHFQRHKSLRTAKHWRVNRARRCSMGSSLESVVSAEDAMMVLDMLVPGHWLAAWLLINQKALASVDMKTSVLVALLNWLDAAKVTCVIFQTSHPGECFVSK